MTTRKAGRLAFFALAIAGLKPCVTVVFAQQAPLQRLQASIERTTRSINATRGIYVKSLDTGAVMTVKDLITMMIIQSDNTATEVLYRMVGGSDAVNARMTALGLNSTRAMNMGAFPICSG